MEAKPGMELLSMEEEGDLRGQAELLGVLFAFAKSMALKAAVLLGIPDTMASNGPGAMLTLDEIADRVGAKNRHFLYRVMRCLVNCGIFSEKQGKYGLTRASKWLVRKGNKHSMAANTEVHLHEVMVAPWHHFTDCILEGSNHAFAKAHGKGLWEFAGENPWFNALFNEAMASSSRACLSAVLEHYHGFDGICTLVDVGGGTGANLASIIATYPSIKGINFDLPHVVAAAPSIQGVEHIGGSMFDKVPHGDAILLKWILHDWDDANCVKILKNCHAALPKDGKMIIADAVLPEDESLTGNNIKVAIDMLMMAVTDGGRERTCNQWCSLLDQAGFSAVKVQVLSDLHSVIEAVKS